MHKAAKLRSASKRDFAEPEGVGDHRNGTEAHRRTGQHGTEQPTKESVDDTRGDGNADQIVEKSPGEILFDVANGGAAQFARTHNSAKIAAEQGNAGVFNGDVRACTHGDAGVSLGQSALQSQGNGNNTINFGNSFGQGGPFSQVAGALLNKEMSIPATITLKQGEAVTLWTTRWVDFSHVYALQKVNP